jgi:hypothetical protein
VASSLRVLGPLFLSVSCLSPACGRAETRTVLVGVEFVDRIAVSQAEPLSLVSTEHNPIKEQADAEAGSSAATELIALRISASLKRSFTIQVASAEASGGVWSDFRCDYGGLTDIDCNNGDAAMTVTSSDVLRVSATRHAGTTNGAAPPHVDVTLAYH